MEYLANVITNNKNLSLNLEILATSTSYNKTDIIENEQSAKLSVYIHTKES